MPKMYIIRNKSNDAYDWKSQQLPLIPCESSYTFATFLLHQI